MTRPEPAGFLMHAAWHADVVPAHKLELSGGPAAPAAARTWAHELLAGRGSEKDRLDVATLVSEIVTNAVRHAGANEHDTIVVHLAIGIDVVRVEVCDHGPGFTPGRSQATRVDGGGHGLTLLERLSSSWGVATDDGTCVWFELALATAA